MKEPGTHLEFEFYYSKKNGSQRVSIIPKLILTRTDLEEFYDRELKKAVLKGVLLFCINITKLKETHNEIKNQLDMLQGKKVTTIGPLHSSQSKSVFVQFCEMN